MLSPSQSLQGSRGAQGYESAALNMPANLENSAVATGLEKVSFHSNPKERQCQRMLKLPHNCTHSQRWRSSLQSAKIRPGADCGSDHELLIAKFRLKLNKVEKTTIPFRYDLNQIPYDYTLDVGIIFNGLDLIDRVPDELWTQVHDIVQETGIKTIPWKRNAKKQKGCLGRPYK